MATAIGDLVATMGMNNKPFIAGANQSMGILRRLGSSVMGTVGKIKGAFGGMGGLLTGAGLLYGAKKAVAAATVQEQAEKKLQAVITATGGAAGFTAKELGAYAAELQKVTNYGDEATISAMGIMASFREIKGDQFKQATRLAQDMSSLLETDLKSSVIMIGKALNDPAIGLTAMSRAGITFTNQQKEQIRTMQKSGDMLGAQKMILAELEQQFGGTAAAMVDPLEQAGNTWGDIMEKIGGFIKPVWVAIAQGFLSTIGWLATFKDKFAAVGASIYALWTASWSAIGGFVASIMDALGVKSGVIADVFRDSLQFIADTFNTLAFVVRNFGALAQVAFIDLVMKGLELFPQLEGPIQSAAAVFIGAWAGAKAFFLAIVHNIIAGIKEVWDAAKALWAGIKAAFSALMSGNWRDLGSAFGKAFVEEYARQAQKVGLNPFAEAVSASKQAVNQFNQRVEKSGGMKSFLDQQRKDLLDSIAKKETGITLAGRKATETAAGLPGVKLPPGQMAAVAAQKKELPKALELGSAEAWKKITAAMYGDKKDKYAEATAKNTERTARGVEELADRDVEEVSIG